MTPADRAAGTARWAGRQAGAATGAFLAAGALLLLTGAPGSWAARVLAAVTGLLVFALLAAGE